MKNTKTNLSITLSKEILELLDKTFHNRSKYIQYCIIKELSEHKKYKDILDKLIF